MLDAVINNKLRRLIKAQLGGLTLLNADPSVHRKAADDRNQAAFELLKAALTQDGGTGTPERPF